jgi:hypothetical protein
VRRYITGVELRLVSTKIINNLQSRFNIDEKAIQIIVDLNVLVETVPIYLELLLENILEDAVESPTTMNKDMRPAITLVIEQEPEFLLISALGLEKRTIDIIQSQIWLPLSRDMSEYKKKLRLLIIRKAIEVLGGTFIQEHEKSINRFQIKLPSSVLSTSTTT